MAILPTDIRILFTNYDIITYFLNLIFWSEHLISIQHRILETFNINKKNQSERLYAFKVPLAIYLTKNENTILLIIKSFKLVKTFKKRNKIGLSARITI